MALVFKALPTPEVRRLQDGGGDAHGRAPERLVSDGKANPCRHCLKEIPEGAEMLVLAYRPFPAPQPYAETGPIFLCAAACPRHPDGPALPEMFRSWERLLARGYGADDRIRYGTGRLVPPADLPRAAAEIFGDARVAYLHLRSATNSCYFCRIQRA